MFAPGERSSMVCRDPRQNQETRRSSLTLKPARLVDYTHSPKDETTSVEKLYRLHSSGWHRPHGASIPRILASSFSTNRERQTLCQLSAFPISLGWRSLRQQQRVRFG